MAIRFDVQKLAAGEAVKVRSVSAATSVVPENCLVLGDATTDAFTITLPLLAHAYDAKTGTGQRVTIKKTDASANAVTVDGASDETIDGGANVSLSSQYDAVTLIAGPSEWHTTQAEGTIAVDPSVLPIAEWESTVLFSDLGSGASDTISLKDQAGATSATFPTNALILSAIRIVNTEFAGEADLADSLGDAGGADDDLESATLHGVAAGAGTVSAPGSFLPRFEPAYVPVATFTATELDDVSAGSITYRYIYVQLSALA